MINSIYRAYYQWAPRPSEIAILNKGLSYAMVWGKHWMQPIQSRMSVRFPFLSAVELDKYDQSCKAAMAFGFELVRRMADTNGGRIDPKHWKADVVAHYPWIGRGNLNMLLGQGKYYAWKDGFLDKI